MSKLIRLKSAPFEEGTNREMQKVKLFISYSHQDSQFIDQFKKHLSPLKDCGLIEEWYDREILTGDDFQQKIDNKLDEADIICLFLSASFLDSASCKSEKNKALKLKRTKGVTVVPIILSPCGWKYDEELSRLLASPTDGVSVSEFENRDKAWQNVCDNLKKRIENEIRLKQLKITEAFETFLQDTEMLSNAHSFKENVFLDDIFVDVELDKFDNLKEYKEKITSSNLLQNLFDHEKIIIAGDDQSGKTTLCKKLFSELRNLNFIPVYVSDKKGHFSGTIENKIFKSLHEQYGEIYKNEIDYDHIVPIIDDFHYAKNADKHLNNLSNFLHCIIVVDDIYSLNIVDDALNSSFTTFKIKELKPSIRYELVKKWVYLRNNGILDNYKDIDNYIGLINTTLGKNLGKGIMPAYPFFILSTIFTYEVFSMPLDREITSQGYCYEAFIYYYLKKHGVKNDEVEIYYNFLTELASFMHKEGKEELNPNEFASFMHLYLEKYYLLIKKDVLLCNLKEILCEDCFRSYNFRYPYFYYFFVAKHLSENINKPEEMENLKKILNNLHVNRNAYIAVFLTHHSKSIEILEELLNVASSLFSKYKPATLTKDEIKFFDEQAHNIINAVLPPANQTPEKERKERLNVQDEMEQSQSDVISDEPMNKPLDEQDILKKDLRKSIRTVEVMGCIIRNRAGSLEKAHVKKIFIEAMDVHLRSLTCFFEIIKSPTVQKEIGDFISKRLSDLEEKEGFNKKMSEEKKRKIADVIFWNICFFVVWGIIDKVIHSLGSDKSIEIGSDACDEVGTPASFLVKHGILMEYEKNPQIPEIYKKLEDDEVSKIADKVMKMMIVDFCSMNKINYRARQRIISLLGISAKNILPMNQKES